jgi:WD40 repeat protein
MGSVDNDGYISSMGDVFLETADDVMTVSWNTNGYYFAFGSKDNKVYMFEGIKNTMVHTFSFSNDVVAIDFSVDGNYFVVACSDLKVYLYYFCGNISELVDSYDVSIGSGSTTTIIDRTCYLNETDLEGCSVCVNATACHVCIVGYYLTSAAECELC